MMSAEYICAGMQDSVEEVRHYALNFPCYTHFTSPIRRYADIMVHRQLTYTIKHLDEIKNKEKFSKPEFYKNIKEHELDEVRRHIDRKVEYDEKIAKEIAKELKWDQKKVDELFHWWVKQPEHILESQAMLHRVAETCNEMKANAKAAQDKSGILFLCFYVLQNPIETIGTVVDIGNKSFTVCIESMGIETRVITQHVKKAKECSISGQMPKSIITIIWNDDSESTFKIFDDMHLKLTANKNKTPMELVATPLQPPKIGSNLTENKEDKKDGELSSIVMGFEND